MKRIFIPFLAASVAFTSSASAAKIADYDFEGMAGFPKIVSNTIEGEPDREVNLQASDRGSALVLDGSYGAYLGEVTNKFSVAAMVKISSDGINDTIFFKNMGDKNSQKWTGVQSRSGKAAFWSHGADGRNKTVVYEAKEAALQEWSYVVYTENAGVGCLYINGILAGKGNVVNGAGSLYLGTTFWEDDAPEGLVDEVRVYDRALSYEEVFNMYYDEYSPTQPKVPDIPKEAVRDMELITTLGIKNVTWETSDPAVITADGKVTRGDEDKDVTLRAFIDGKQTNEFVVRVPKKPEAVNDKVILSYKFGENDSDLIHDISGNGNHATAYNKLSVTKDGAYFDGMDDYVQLPDGVLNGHDNITIVFNSRPEKEQQHIFAYVFGNSSSEGYMFLNTNRPSTMELRFAATPEGSGRETAVYHSPGIASEQWGNAVVTISGTTASLYLDGELKMTGDLGMTVSELGDTTANYIAKSLYESDGYFKGLVKEFTVYNYAMDQSEVKALYTEQISEEGASANEAE